jgi:hypothetical protein
MLCFLDKIVESLFPFVGVTNVKNGLKNDFLEWTLAEKIINGQN